MQTNVACKNTPPAVGVHQTKHHGMERKWYFITISTKGAKQHFGYGLKGKIFLSPQGYIAKKCWLAVPQQFPDIMLDDFVIMPNHLHGIVRVDHRFHTPHSESLPDAESPLGLAIRMYKMMVSCTINHLPANGRFAWQPRFHQRYIRDAFELYRLRRYIRDNPKKWLQD